MQRECLFGQTVRRLVLWKYKWLINKYLVYGTFSLPVLSTQVSRCVCLVAPFQISSARAFSTNKTHGLVFIYHVGLNKVGIGVKTFISEGYTYLNKLKWTPMYILTLTKYLITYFYLWYL